MPEKGPAPRFQGDRSVGPLKTEVMLFMCRDCDAIFESEVALNTHTCSCTRVSSASVSKKRQTDPITEFKQEPKAGPEECAVSAGVRSPAESHVLMNLKQENDQTNDKLQTRTQASLSCGGVSMTIKEELNMCPIYGVMPSGHGALGDHIRAREQHTMVKKEVDLQNRECSQSTEGASQRGNNYEAFESLSQEPSDSRLYLHVLPKAEPMRECPSTHVKQTESLGRVTTLPVSRKEDNWRVSDLEAEPNSGHTGFSQPDELEIVEGGDQHGNVMTIVYPAHDADSTKRSFGATENRKETPATKRQKPTLPPEGYVCLFCGVVFSHKPWFDLHMDGHIVKSFPCKVCGQTFQQKKDLRKHVLTEHDGASSDYRFVQENFMKQPTVLSNERFKCQVCHQSFACDSALEEHEKSRELGGCFQCSRCGERFEKKWHLHVHQHSAPQCTWKPYCSESSLPSTASPATKQGSSSSPSKSVPSRLKEMQIRVQNCLKPKQNSDVGSESDNTKVAEDRMDTAINCVNMTDKDVAFDSNTDFDDNLLDYMLQ